MKANENSQAHRSRPNFGFENIKNNTNLSNSIQCIPLIERDSCPMKRLLRMVVTL